MKLLYKSSKCGMFIQTGFGDNESVGKTGMKFWQFQTISFDVPKMSALRMAGLCADAYSRSRTPRRTARGYQEVDAKLKL